MFRTAMQASGACFSWRLREWLDPRTRTCSPTRSDSAESNRVPDQAPHSAHTRVSRATVTVNSTWFVIASTLPPPRILKEPSANKNQAKTRKDPTKNTPGVDGKPETPAGIHLAPRHTLKGFDSHTRSGSFSTRAHKPDSHRTSTLKPPPPINIQSILPPCPPSHPMSAW